MSDIQPRAAAGLEDDDLEDARPSEVEVPTSSPDEPRSGFSSQKSSHVVVPKATDTTRIGIGLRPDMPDRAVVHTIAPGTPADLAWDVTATTATVCGLRQSAGHWIAAS